MSTFDELLRTLDRDVWQSMDRAGAGDPALFPQILMDPAEPIPNLLAFEGPWWQ